MSLGDILVFATASDEVPPCGFDPLPTVEFWETKGQEETHALTQSVFQHGKAMTMSLMKNLKISWMESKICQAVDVLKVTEHL